jgi:hypothetical protein
MSDVKKTEVDVNAVLREAQATGNLSESKFMALLSIMMAKEARIAEKEAALEVALQARDKQRRVESENYTIAKIENQKNCKHLKGGKGRTRGQQRDPSVYPHTFTDGKIVIKCTLCGARWLPGDTDEYLTRNGSKIPNWTGIGWRRAQEMAEDSSNKASSSERFGGAHISAESTKTGKALAETPNLQI